MKKTTLLFALLLSYAVSAQSNYYSVYMDNVTSDQTHLSLLPWDDSKLIQVYKEVDNISFEVSYHMEYGMNGLPFGVPGCGLITAKPEFIDNGILVVGSSLNKGVELHYYDGANATVLDINSGAGDSNPVIHRLKDKVYVVADNGNGARNIFEFDENTQTLEQRSFETLTTEMVGLIEFGNEIYTNNKIYDFQSGIATFQLAKYDAQGNKSIVKSSSSSIGSGEVWNWYGPLEKWGELFMVESYIQSNSASGQIRVLPVLSTNEYNSLDYFISNSGVEPQIILFEDDSKLYAYRFGADSLFSLEEHVQGAPVQSYQLEVEFSEGVIVEHFVSENNQLYFKVVESQSYVNKVVRLNGISETVLVEDDRVHITLESDGIIYANRYDHFSIGTDEPCAVYLINTAFDVVDKVDIELGLHGPYIDAAVMFEGKYTFFFKESNNSVDIVQLDSSPLAGIPSLSNSLNVYPNPSINGQWNFEVPQKGDVQITTTEGKIVAVESVHEGTNVMPTLPSGIYMIHFNEVTKKLIIR